MSGAGSFVNLSFCRGRIAHGHVGNRKGGQRGKLSRPPRFKNLELANDRYPFPRGANVSSPLRRSPANPRCCCRCLLTCRSAGPKDVVRMALVEARACGGSSVSSFRAVYPQWLSIPPANTRRRFFFSARSSSRTLTASRSAALDDVSDSRRQSVTATTPPPPPGSHPGRRWCPGRRVDNAPRVERSVVVVVVVVVLPRFHVKHGTRAREGGLCVCVWLPGGNQAGGSLSRRCTSTTWTSASLTRTRRALMTAAPSRSG